MDVQQSRRPRDRPLFLDLLLIAAVMAFLMWGGLTLLGRTHAAWDARSTERATRAESIRLAAERGIAESKQVKADRNRALVEQRLQQIRDERERQEARIRKGRCVHGILFAEIDGALTNIGKC